MKIEWWASRGIDSLALSPRYLKDEHNFNLEITFWSGIVHMRNHSADFYL